MKRAVLDASVILKWYLADEELGEKALSLLYGFVANEVEILSPSLLEYEVLNGLIMAQKKGRIKEERIVAAIEGFMDLEVDMKDLTDFYRRVLHYSRAYNRSAYDASYLALAEVEGISLITADEGLYNAVKKDLKWVKWLGDI